MSTQFRKGDKVELTDSLKFQFGAKRTYHTGEVVAVVDGDGMQIVATVLEETALGVTRDGPRIDHVIDGTPTPLVLIERGPEPEVQVTQPPAQPPVVVQPEPAQVVEAAVEHREKPIEAAPLVSPAAQALADADPFGLVVTEIAPKKAATTKAAAR